MKVANHEIAKRISISLLSDSIISAYCSETVYERHLSQIKDSKIPCISIHCFEDDEPEEDEKKSFEFVDIESDFQIEFWVKRIQGAKPNWTMILLVNKLIESQIKKCIGLDESSRVRILKIFLLENGPQLIDSDTQLMHIPNRYRIRGTNVR